MRLIDIEPFETEKDVTTCQITRWHNGDGYSTMAVMNTKDIPTIEAELVKHGRWEEIQYYPVTRTLEATCSHCKVRGKIRSGGNQCGFLVPDSKRCPNCGAKMDLEETK